MDWDSSQSIALGVIIVVFAAWVFLRFRELRREEARAEARDAREAAAVRARQELDEEQLRQVETCLHKHSGAILRRLRRLGMPDEYGVKPDHGIEREADHFFENVLFVETNICRGGSLGPDHWRNQMCSFFYDMYDVMVNEGVPPPLLNDGLAYERNVGAEFARQGFAISYTPLSGDQGVDLVATRGDQVVAVQCKDYRGSVGNDAVQQVYAGASLPSHRGDCRVAG